MTNLITSGGAKTKLDNGILEIWTDRSISSIAFNLTGESYKHSKAALPESYRLPFRIDMKINLDHPAFILLVGKGHITFGTGSQDNHKIEDILKPSGKPNQDKNSFNNAIPLNEYAYVSVVFGLNQTQILIGGEERFYSGKQPYMKDIGGDKLEISLAVSKSSLLSVKELNVTEYDSDPDIVRGSFTGQDLQLPLSQKLSFQDILTGLPDEYREELLSTDTFLRSLRPLKFKRSVDKGGKISYIASDCGISYIIRAAGGYISHNFGWYIITSGKAETWHRKTDYMEEILEYISVNDPGLAGRIFYSLNDCVGCYGSMCLAKTAYKFKGQKRLTCHGRVKFNMSHSDFQDVREFFRILNIFWEKEVIKEDRND